MIEATHYDVAISGAGPAGSSLAAILARRGFRVLLVDRAAFPRDKACGEYTSPETELLLGRLGVMGELEDGRTRRLHSMHVISPSGRRFSLDYSQPGEELGWRVLATPRRVLDSVLLENAGACGARVWERVKVEALTMRDGRPGGLVLRERDGSVREVRARMIVGADGVHSAVVRSLGLSAPLRWPQTLGLVAHYEGHRGLEEHGEMHVSQHGYAGLAPLAGGLLNVGLVMPLKRAKLSGHLPAAERFERFAYSFPGVAEILRGSRRVSSIRGVGPIGARVRRTSGAGYLLVGDAAGFFDPFTGEGVHRALRGAELAAEVAANALERDDLSAASLARYSRLRHAEFASKEWVCRLVQLFVALPPAMDYVAARLAARTWPRQVLTGVLGDYADPRLALSPAYLWSVLRP